MDYRSRYFAHKLKIYYSCGQQPTSTIYYASHPRFTNCLNTRWGQKSLIFALHVSVCFFLFRVVVPPFLPVWPSFYPPFLYSSVCPTCFSSVRILPECFYNYLALPDDLVKSEQLAGQSTWQIIEKNNKPYLEHNRKCNCRNRSNTLDRDNDWLRKIH